MENILDRLKTLRDRNIKLHKEMVEKVANRCGSKAEAEYVCSSSALLTLAELIEDKIKELEGGKDND